MEIAPPLTFTRSAGICNASRQCSTWQAKASLISHRPMSRHAQAKALEQLGHRHHRADAHFLGGATAHGNAPIDAQRSQPATLGFRTTHQQAGRCTVGKLRSVAGSNELSLLNPFTVLPHRLERRQVFQARVGAIAFVALDQHTLMSAGLAGGIETQLVDAQANDFLVEQSVTLGGGGAQLALQGILVLGRRG